MEPAHTVALNNWNWKQRNENVSSVLNEIDAPLISKRGGTKDSLKTSWRAAQTYPSEIHVELLKEDFIPDPYTGFNEHSIQWVGETEWLYETKFPLEQAENGTAEHALLEFQGLDTVCDIYLNGDKVLSVDNMFQTHHLHLQTSELKHENTLLLHFKSAALLSRELEATFGRVRAGSTNLGDPSRVYMRKAQYHWRWDWGPEIMACGIYRPVTLTTYSLRISDVFAKANVDSSGCALDVDLDIDGSVDDVKARIELKDMSGATIKTEEFSGLKGGTNLSVAKWQLAESVKLWWPVGYGEQALYTVEVSLFDSQDHLIDSQSKRVGFRTVKLIQEEIQEADQYGTGSTFLFEVNGVRIFIGGSNWIPGDNFLTTLKPDRYRAWLYLLQQGNQNMVRLWGGGVYEPDVFYDTCDELGILVWQDFQFACGVYPAHDEFLKSVKKEAEDNVKRLRHHASMAIFCGNNEDYQMILQWGDVKDFPAVKIYEDLLPSVVEALTASSIPYHRGSPYGGKGWDTADPTVGDVHQWNIWGGKELQYHEYDKMGGRFVSEFGMPSMPCLETVQYWSKGFEENGKQMYAQSPLMAQHCKAGLFERRFAIPMNENFKTTTDLETYVYTTQLMQSEAVAYAYQSWRRQWKGPGQQYTSGVIVWQLNDCWPVTSWAIVDYFLRPKPAYYTIKRQMASVAVGIFRTVTKNKANDRPRQFYEYGAYQSQSTSLDVWGVNASLEQKSAKLEIHCIDLISDWTHTESHEVVLKANQSTELLNFPCPSPPNPSATGYPEWTTASTVIVNARLIDPSSGEVLARFADWPQPYRYLSPPDPELSVHVDESAGVITVEAKRPAKGVVLSVETMGDSPVMWSDNALDVIPGDPQTLNVSNLRGRKVQVAWLGGEKARQI